MYLVNRELLVILKIPCLSVAKDVHLKNCNTLRTELSSQLFYSLSIVLFF